MKKFVSVVLAIVAGVLLMASPAAIAADLANGAAIFSSNCAACHAGGGNLVNAAKTLKKADLEQYGMASMDAIQTQIRNGKMAMPSFKGRLTEDQIANVAAYVLEQAEKGW